MTWTPRQRALLRLDRLMRRGFPIPYQRRIRATRDRLSHDMLDHEWWDVRHAIIAERRHGARVRL